MSRSARRARTSRHGTAAALVALLLTTSPSACGGADAPRPTTDTRIATLSDPDHDGVLNRAAGEPLRDRGRRGSTRGARTLATLVQISDAHVRDEESPARIPFLDRLGTPYDSTFRPQEALTLQALAATADAARAVRPDAVVQTGDLADNAQRDELTEALKALRGGLVEPDSGRRGPGGPQLESDPDPFFYRPDVDAPRHPGLLAQAQQPFRARGVGAPLHNVVGNHDLLVAGELVPDTRTQRLATGDQATVRLDLDALRGVRIPKAQRAGEAGAGALGTSTVQRVLESGATVRVAADPARREVTPSQARRLLRGPGERADRGLTVFRIGAVRAIGLDLVRRAGGSAGLLPEAEHAALRAELARDPRTPTLVLSHQPLGDSLLRELSATPGVIAAIAGHTHRNAVAERFGLWTIQTASLADFPQQARAIRIVRTRDDRIAIEAWMLDHGPGPGALAKISRDLAFLDAQGGRPGHFAGTPTDRNVRLWVPRGRAA